MDEEDKLREDIVEKVKEIYKIRKYNEKFIKGETRINYSGRTFDENEMIALVNSSIDFWLTLGNKGIEFCNKFKQYLGIKYCLVTNSGSSSNLIAVSTLCSKNIENPMVNRDEVITTAVAFPTTLNPIIQNGLIPIFIDIEEGTYNIDVSKIEGAITDKTKAIMIAHTLGNPVDMDEIMRISKKYKLYVIEDTCDALGSTYDGKLCGTFGDFSTYSFYAAHHITMGEGGALCTNSPILYKNALSIRDWGRACYCQTGEKNPNGACAHRFDHKYEDLPYGYDHKYVYSNIGYNLKPLDLQCAIGIEQLYKLPQFIQLRKNNFNALLEYFKQYEEFFILPKKLPKADPSWFGIPLTVRFNAGFTRKELIMFLESKLIETRMLFSGNILKQPGYKDINYRTVGELTNTEKVLEGTFFLGVYPGINDEKLEYIIECMEMFLKNGR